MRVLSLLIIGLLSVSFINAEVFSDCSIYGNCKAGTTATTSTNVNYSSVNTNYSLNSGQLEGRNTSSLYAYFKSLYDTVYCSLTGCKSALGSPGQIAYFNGTDFVIGSSNFTYNSTTNQLSINRNTAPISPPTITGTALRINGADNEMVRFGITSYGVGGTSGYSVRQARGTGASPTATQSGDLLGQFDAFGRSTSAFTLTPKAILKMFASDNFNDTAQGSYVSIWTTKRNTIVPTESLRIDDGYTSIYGSLNSTNNITAYEYLFGQPLTGMLGSGIIWANGTNNFAEVSINCTGLNCDYRAFKVRLVNTTNDVKYCDIPAGTITASDNTHNVFYIDNSCAVQKTTIQTYIATPISPGGIADFGNVVFQDGTAYNQNGIGLENKRIIKLRKLLLQSTGKHLSIIDGGFNFQENVYPKFNITAGNYVYLMDVVSSTSQNTATDKNEIIYSTGSGTWAESDQTGINVTTCVNSTGLLACSNPTRYRRAFVFMVGYNETTDETQTHQLLPMDSKSYTNLADCINIVNNPVTYTLPTFYQYSAIPLYAYCGRVADTGWNVGGLIDLRATSGGGGSASTDISGLVPYSGAVSNVDLDRKNISTSTANVTYITFHNIGNSACSLANGSMCRNNTAIYITGGL